MAEPQVLILEDDALIALDLADALSDRGWAILGPCGSQAEAAQILMRHVPDAAVLDVHMADGTTLELAARLAGNGVAVVFLTGETRLTLPDALMALPVLTKPIDHEALAAALTRAR